MIDSELMMINFLLINAWTRCFGVSLFCYFACKSVSATSTVNSAENNPRTCRALKTPAGPDMIL